MTKPHIFCEAETMILVDKDGQQYPIKCAPQIKLMDSPDEPNVVLMVVTYRIPMDKGDAEDPF